MEFKLSNESPCYQVLGNCYVQYLPVRSEVKQLDLTKNLEPVHLSAEDYQKLCEGTYVCCDFLPCKVENGGISEVALAVRGDLKSVIPDAVWFFGGRNKLISKPFADLEENMDSIIDKNPAEFQNLLALKGQYLDGYIEVIRREGGDTLGNEVQILPLGVALTRFLDPHQIGLSKYLRQPALSLKNYGRLLSRAASEFRIIRYPYEEHLSPEDYLPFTEHSIGAVRSTIQPVVALLLPAEVYDKWGENKTANPGEGILKVIRVTRQDWENGGAIELGGTRCQPLAFVRDVIGEVFEWNRQ